MTVDKNDLRNTYLTFLEEDIIKELAILLDVDNRVAMEKYYGSRLCQEIGSGEYGIEYMDSKYLAKDLIENEPELFIKPNATANSRKMPRAEMFGCMRGQIKMADDFNAPLEDFYEYMYTDEELKNMEN